MSPDPIKVAAFYQFARLPQFEALQAPLRELLKRHQIKGSVLLAGEGINGTVAGLPASIDAALLALSQLTGLDNLAPKFSTASVMPFKRLRVRLKKEIVTIGDVAADPLAKVGTYVEPAAWNALISDPDVVLIDTRNSYEVGIGTFQGAIDPGTESFGEFPAFVRDTLKARPDAKIAMFCTGGIRCEKASSLMLHEGFANVFHLKGGILSYLEQVPAAESRWSGACFVFDERVAVEHGLAPSDYTMCHGCLKPVSAASRLSPRYEEGVCCPACADTLTEAQKASNRERQRQVVLAEQNNRQHLGPAKR
jgi:UPF0176 protein